MIGRRPERRRTSVPALREYDEARDGDWLLALNNAHVAEVGEVTRESLADLTRGALAVRVADADGRPAGALVALARGLAYDSLNYRWFVERDDMPFLYIDRVIVDAAARGRGLAQALYEDAARIARAHAIPRLVCEVNEIPPNLRSLAFHVARGFAPLLSWDNPASGKRVLMMEKRLDEGFPVSGTTPPV